jgi:iron complex transport system substrate-binding protein
MRARPLPLRSSPPGRRFLAGLVLVAALLGSGPARAGAPPRRVVSLNPSLTAILVAIGARESLVGVDEFSAREEPAVAGLPTVGGLYNPSLEGVLALRPDLVVLVPSAEQRDFRARLAQLAVPVLSLDPLSLDDVLRSIETLGARVGRAEAAQQRAEAIRTTRRATEARLRGRPRPRAVLVLQRDPLYVVGKGSFADDLLGAAGVENVAAAFPEPYPRVSLEWLIAAAPEVLLDAAPEPQDAASFWSRWASLPAVRAGRVITLEPGLVTLPGPWLDRGLLQLAERVHGAEALAAPPEARP